MKATTKKRRDYPGIENLLKFSDFSIPHTHTHTHKEMMTLYFAWRLISTFSFIQKWLFLLFFFFLHLKSLSGSDLFLLEKQQQKK